MREHLFAGICIGRDIKKERKRAECRTFEVFTFNIQIT